MYPEMIARTMSDVDITPANAIVITSTESTA